MSLSQFVHDLAHTGRVLLGPIDDTDEGELQREIRDLDRRLRLHAPGTAPPLHEPAAEWAATRLYHSCVFSKERDTPSEEVAAWLTASPEFSCTAATSWSVDLFLRCLPDLDSLALSLPEADALRTGLRNLAAQWPLSGAAFAGVDFPADRLGVVLEHDCLRRLFAERRGDDPPTPARQDPPAVTPP